MSSISLSAITGNVTVPSIVQSTSMNAVYTSTTTGLGGTSSTPGTINMSSGFTLNSTYSNSSFTGITITTTKLTCAKAGTYTFNLSGSFTMNTSSGGNPVSLYFTHSVLGIIGAVATVVGYGSNLGSSPIGTSATIKMAVGDTMQPFYIASNGVQLNLNCLSIQQH